MALSINNLMVNEGPAIHYDAAFRIVIEAHLRLLREHPNTSYMDIEPQKAYKYEFDLYGLLYSLNIAPHYHWIVMRVNDLTTPSDFTHEMIRLILPSAGVIDSIRNTHVATYKKQ